MSNPSSNTAYKNIGYVEQSPIDEVSLERENSFDSISDK